MSINGALLLNIQRSFCHIRSFTYAEPNIELLRILHHCVKNNVDNQGFLKLIQTGSKELQSYVLQYLLISNEGDMYGDAMFCHIIESVIGYTIQLLVHHRYDEAYDIVDAFEVFAELGMKQKNIDYKRYYKIFIYPIYKKWKNPFAKEMSNLFKEYSKAQR